MASLRDIRTRIASVKSTRQITNAMKMVAAAKLRRATESATNARPYQQALTSTIQRVAAGAGDVEHPLLTSRQAVVRVAVCVVGSDRGLCGGFNSNRDRRVEEFLKAQRAEGKEIILRTFGKKPRDFLTNGFEAGEFDEAYVCYNAFKSTLTQIPTISKVLPLAITATEAASVDYTYEPNGAEILGTLLPLYLRTILLQAFLENEAGFFASQMTAMDNATRNASDLIDRLTIEYNRSRQAAITRELIEIISGAEAL